MSSHEAVFGGQPIPDPYPGRRQLDELTGEELAATPAWWFPGRDASQLVGPDEATVMPLDAGAAAADGSVDSPDGKYLLHAAFVLADGTRADGHVTFVPGDDGSLSAREPTLCTPRGQVPLWFGALSPTDEQLRAHLAAIGRPRDAVFPLRWTASLHPPGVALAGAVAGFAVLRGGAAAFV
jgi:hypothetical protein